MWTGFEDVVIHKKIVGEDSIIILGQWKENKMVFKLTKAKQANGTFMENVYRQFHTKPFPAYVMFGNNYQTDILMDNKMYKMIAYPYMSCVRKTKVNAKTAASVVSPLVMLHRVFFPHETSVYSPNIKSSYKISNKILMHIGDTTLAKTYDSMQFLTGNNLLHGDYRLDNILDDGLFIIDLEDATIGPPEYDIGRLIQSVLWETNCSDGIEQLISKYEQISLRKINRLYVGCAAILRLSHRLRMDRIELSDIRIRKFAESIKQMITQ